MWFVIWTHAVTTVLIVMVLMVGGLLAITLMKPVDLSGPFMSIVFGVLLGLFRTRSAYGVARQPVKAKREGGAAWAIPVWSAVVTEDGQATAKILTGWCAVEGDRFVVRAQSQWVWGRSEEVFSRSISERVRSDCIDILGRVGCPRLVISSEDWSVEVEPMVTTGNPCLGVGRRGIQRLQAELASAVSRIDQGWVQ